MTKTFVPWLFVSLLFLMLAALACSGYDDGPSVGVARTAGSPGLAGVSGESGLTAASAPAPASDNAASAAATSSSTPSDSTESPGTDPLEFNRVQQAALAQNRVIVHTAKMAIVVVNVAQVMEGITDLAGSLGGWIVSADRSSASLGAISLRVPSESLDTAMDRISTLGILEESRAITSQDVTEEFVDSQSRLASMRATEQRLLSFLNQARTVEDALLVQEQLTLLQQDIEQTQGRINALSERAAFSLIEVTLRLTPIAIGVDAGPDFSARAGEQVRFQASFAATPGIDNFSYQWDLGDGTLKGGNRTALTPEGNRITATISHSYADDSGSPYIVNFSITGSGEGGIVEGSDSVLATVKSVPPISLFAGENRTVEEGEEVDFTASFTRPEELRNFEYRWDFGDGSATVQGAPEEGATRVTVEHTYQVYHPDPYTATVTVSAISEAGPVTASESFSVYTTQAESFVVGEWNITGTTKAAVRALTVLAQGVTVFLIWVLVFVPVILVFAGLYLLVRRFFPNLLTTGGPRRPGPWGASPHPPQSQSRRGSFPSLADADQQESAQGSEVTTAESTEAAEPESEEAQAKTEEGEGQEGRRET